MKAIVTTAAALLLGLAVSGNASAQVIRARWNTYYATPYYNSYYYPSGVVTGFAYPSFEYPSFSYPTYTYGAYYPGILLDVVFSAILWRRHRRRLPCLRLSSRMGLAALNSGRK